MDSHKAQKTGNMYYVYLPSAWCAKHSIKSRSPISLASNPDGTLTLSATQVEHKPNLINLRVGALDNYVLIKLIVACYVNPLTSFTIECEKETNITELLEQKQFIGALDFIEFDGKKITYESSLRIEDPYSILTGMIRKIQNLFQVMIHNYNKDLIMRYEDEIDRSKLMIQKAVISILAQGSPTSLSPIELHYLSLLAQHIERMVDYLTNLPQDEIKFIESVRSAVDSLKKVLANPKDFTPQQIMDLTQEISTMKRIQVTDLTSYYKRRIRSLLISICEVLLDWSVTNQIKGKQ